MVYVYLQLLHKHELNSWSPSEEERLGSDYHGFEVAGFAGTGTVVNFNTLQHTTYLCHGIMGINGYMTTVCE